MSSVKVIVIPNWNDSSNSGAVFYNQLFTELAKKETSVLIVSNKERFFSVVSGLNPSQTSLFLKDDGLSESDTELIKNRLKELALSESSLKTMREFLGEDHDLNNAYDKLSSWTSEVEGGPRRSKES
jgi:hypothetical protein